MNTERRDRRHRGFDSISSKATNVVTWRTVFLAAKIQMWGLVRKLKSVLFNQGYKWLVSLLHSVGLLTWHQCKKDVVHWGGAGCQPPCSVVSAATSTSSSERLSPLRSSSWYTGISSASGLCHGSPTSLINTDKQHLYRMLRLVT